MATKGFTKIENSIIFDLELTPAAFMLYAVVKHYASIEGFKINREHIKSVSGYGETAFRRAWKELKDKGLLIQGKERAKGKFEYTYYLEGGKPSKAKDLVSKDDGKIHIDSDGNKTLKGQVTIDDVLPQGEEDKQVKNENVDVISEGTGLNEKQSKELLKAAGDDITKVFESYKYVMQQRQIKNIFGYTKWAIKNINTIGGVRGSSGGKGYFNNYKQRTYDFNKLERALLYGEEYELPA